MANTVCKNLLVVPISFTLFFAPSALNCQAPARTNTARPPLEPYTAEFKITFVRTLPNGTVIQRESKEIEARDSNSRTFRQTVNAAMGANQATNTISFVNDPTDGTNMNWQSRTHEVVVRKLPPQDQRQGCWRNDAGTFSANFGPHPTSPAPVAAAASQRPTVPQQQIEDLGTTVIEGIEAHGHRITRTVPAGSIGNDQPLVTTIESWSAPSLMGLTLRSVTDDPRNGKTTREVVRLDLGEPEQTIFQPPSDYKVQTMEMHQVPCEQLPH
jgi:hypothetical protein